MHGKTFALAVALMVVLVPATVLLAPVEQGAAALPALLPAGAAEVAGTSAAQLPEVQHIYHAAPQSFRILDRSTGRVFEMTAAEFVRGAVAAEMPALYHPEALKAQAVAAYTYAVRQALAQSQSPDPALRGADFAADPANLQVCLTEAAAREFYGESFDYYWSRICAAADSAGQYLLLYEGQPAATAYHAISAGTTEAAAFVWAGEELPYLQAVESPGDLLAAEYESTFTIPATRLAQKLAEALPNLQLPESRAEWVVPVEWSPSGYVTRVQVGEEELTGARLRFLLGLRSSHFQVAEEDGLFTFTVQGYGHGVGLSQNGADYMARQGATFDQILLHYYPGTTLALAAAE